MKRKLLTLSLALLMVTVIFAGCMGAVEFDVNFISDGEIIHTISTTGDETIKMPENPVKEGYTFDGWYWDKDTWQRPFTASSLLNEPLNGDMSVYAKWTPKDLENESFEVSFNTMGGSYVNGQIVKYNGFVSEPAEPTKNGYIFAGWYKDADMQGKWDFLTDKVTGKTTIYAKWVSANDNEGAEIISADGFEVDGSTLKMTVPYEKENVAVSALIKVSPSATYMVSKDIEGNEAIPTGTVTLNEGKNVFYILVTSGSGSNKSQYTVEIERERAPLCSVTLELNDGSLNDDEKTSLSFEWGEAIEKLPTPTKNGYKFEGWALNGEIISFPYTPESHITLSAVWAEAGMVYFDTDGGKMPDGTSDTVQIKKGEAIGALPVPTKYGFSFEGWYVDGYRKVNQTYVVEKDIELVAMWKSLGELVMVEFMLGTGEEMQGEITYFEILKGERICTVLNELPTASKTGYRFGGWKDANGTYVTATTKVTTDMTLSPIWERIVYCLDGTENHVWNAWQETTEATCTEAGKMARVCGICGHRETKYYAEPTGHELSESKLDVVEGIVCRSRTCKICEEIFITAYENITYDNFNTPITDGVCWGAGNVNSLIDGYISNATTGSVCPTGASEFSITLEAKQATYIDIFTVSGKGISAYTVSVVYSDGRSEDLGIGSFGLDGTTKAFIVEAEVVKIEVSMPSPSQGMDYFQELGAYVEGKEESNGHYFIETVHVSDTGAVSLIRDCAHCDLVEEKTLNNITYANFSIPTIDGNYYYGSGAPINLIDGDFKDKKVAGNGRSALTVTLEAKSATYIDIFTVTGTGSATYTVTVTYADGREIMIGVGSFVADGTTKAFTIEDTVTKIEIYMQSPSDGLDYWHELGAFVISE